MVWYRHEKENKNRKQVPHNQLFLLPLRYRDRQDHLLHRRWPVGNKMNDVAIATIQNISLPSGSKAVTKQTYSCPSTNCTSVNGLSVMAMLCVSC